MYVFTKQTRPITLDVYIKREMRGTMCTHVLYLYSAKQVENGMLFYFNITSIPRAVIHTCEYRTRRTEEDDESK